MKEGNLPLALLGLIGCRPEGAHGYRLKREAEALCDDASVVNFGRVYRTLDALEKEGALEASEEPQSGRPNRKIYRITRAGLATLRAWLDRPIPDEPYPLRAEIAMRLMFMEAGDMRRMADLFERQRAACMGKLRRYSRNHTVLRKAGVAEEIANMILDGAETRLRAELDWLERAERRIVRTPAPERARGGQPQSLHAVAAAE